MPIPIDALTGRLRLLDLDYFFATPLAVHVWLVNGVLSSEQIEYAHRILSSDEVERAQRFKFDSDRCTFIASRCALRLFLGAYSRRPPGAIEFSLGPYGKPAVPGLAFNVSHSGQCALIAIASGAAVGVDLEKIRPRISHDELAGRFFSPREQDWLLSQPVESRLRNFYRLWVSKEAVMKATGRGLSMPIAAVDVGFAEDDTPHLISGEWLLYELGLMEDYLGAVALPADGGYSITIWADE
jgi:4'-phosphopantetheinyl transferase